MEKPPEKKRKVGEPKSGVLKLTHEKAGKRGRPLASVIANPKRERRSLQKVIRVSPSEAERMDELAKIYAGGDFSVWMRYAAQNFHPERPLLIVKQVRRVR